jgi:nicotinate-nucleotide pyrophosphorylase (carboxylating)
MDDIDRFLYEDLDDDGDITSNFLPFNKIMNASIISNEYCILAGLEEAYKVFKKTGANLIFLKKDGDIIKKNEKVADINAPIKSILKGERLALNFISRMSGIATITYKLVKKCRKINKNINIAATRKTTPGFRFYEKKAVVIGGGISHRMGLYDQILIKDNHIKSFGSVSKALKIVKKNNPYKIIEIEVENEKDSLTAAKIGADVIMLDNFSPIKAKKTVKKIREINNKIEIEISGGITPKNIINYASFSDRISVGYITHSVKNIDYSLEIE